MRVEVGLEYEFEDIGNTLYGLCKHYGIPWKSERRFAGGRPSMVITIPADKHHEPPFPAAAKLFGRLVSQGMADK